ncbi:MAG: hypothetical protein ABFR53_09800, partial [Actinomycetota bacterium]
TDARRGAGIASAPEAFVVRWISGVSFDDATTKAWVLGWGVCVAELPAVVLAELGLATGLGAPAIV